MVRLPKKLRRYRNPDIPAILRGCFGTLYVDTGGSATNSGSSDNNAADLTGANATVAGSVVSLDGAPDLSGLQTSGANQSAIYLNQATNSNRKIFWITAVDNGAKTVTVDTAPTGVTGSAWAIGGRFVYTAASIQAALRAGDVVVINNSPASFSVDALLMRASGDATSGRIFHKGKAGTRPVITVTNTNQCIDFVSSINGMSFDNLELVQQGASGVVVNSSNGWRLTNVKITDGGGIAVTTGVGCAFINMEITGTGGGFTLDQDCRVNGVNVHDVSGNGVASTGASASFTVTKSIFDTCSGKGFSINGAAVTFGIPLCCIDGCTIYGCGDSGVETTNAGVNLILVNSILAENGNAAGEFNAEFTLAAELVCFHAWNVFYHSGGGGGANLSGLTANAMVSGSEFTTDPQFTDAANGDFSIGSSSPAKAAGFPGQFLG